MRKRWPGVVLALLAGACGGGGAKTQGTIPAEAKDQLAVDAAVLQVTDLPGTWDTNRPASTASESLQTGDDVLTIADECFPTRDGIAATTGREYVSGRQLGRILVRGVVEAHADPASISGKLGSFTPASAAPCVKDFVGKVLASTGAAPGDPNVQPATVEAVGEERGGFVVSVPVTSPGGDFVIGADIVFARVGRFRATCTVIHPPTESAESLCAGGLKAMVRRLELSGS